MDADRWQRLKNLIDAASHLPPDARAAYIHEACEDDPALGVEAESLLRADEHADSLLQQAVLSAGPLQNPSFVGRRLGAYQVTRELGQGGMGAVFLAVRADDEYRKEVAIKLIRAGAHDPEIRRRFLVERQILASLDHPHIARLLDGGTTDDDLPYVVMEYVDGEPLTAYCDRRGLSVDARLALLLRVCDAVQFAHRNLVVHRDLKPGNILVTTDGQPKLLDFGIAKLLDAPPGADRTRTTFRPMTPEYASPEQVRGEAITTATDVYALGVLLCELLSGHRPYRLDQPTPQAVESAITTQAPERPSTAIFRGTAPRETGDAEPRLMPAAIAAARGTTAPRLRRQLAGDLDTITLMALRKEPERRYASVEQLAEDIRRYLGGLPVHARPDTLRYRATKFVVRHRGAVVAAATMVALIVALTAFYTVRLARERDRARLESEKATQVATFLGDVFKAADPTEVQQQDISIRVVLKRGADQIERELASQPAVQAQLMRVIGGVYGSLADYAEASRFLEASLKRSEEIGDEVELANVLNDLGWLAAEKGEYATATSYHQRALTLRERVLPLPHADVVRSLAHAGFSETRRGDLGQAESFIARAVEMGRQLPATPNNVSALCLALEDLGRLRFDQSRYAEAVTVLTEAVDRRRKEFGDDDEDLGSTLDTLAEAYRLDGKPADAERLFREAIANAARFLPDDHPTVVTRVSNLANAVLDLGKYEEATALYQRALDANRKRFGSKHPRVPSSLNNLATAYTRTGRYDDAERLLLEALDLHRANHGDQHESIATVLSNLAHVMGEKRDFRKAASYQRRALQMDRQLLGDTHAYVGQDLTLLGIFLLADGQAAASEAPLREGVEVIRAAIGLDHPRTAVALYALGCYLAAARRFDEGEEVARDVIRLRTAALPAGHWETALAETLLGEILAATGRDAEAEPLLVNGYEVIRAALPQGGRHRDAARDRVVRFFETRGQQARADAIR